MLLRRFRRKKVAGEGNQRNLRTDITCPEFHLEIAGKGVIIARKMIMKQRHMKNKNSLFLLSGILIFAALMSVSGCASAIQNPVAPIPEEGTLPTVDQMVADNPMGPFNLSGKEVDASYVDSLRERAPGCVVKWDVPFSFGKVSSESENLTSSSITEADIDLFRYMNRLARIDGKGSDCGTSLKAFADKHPDIRVDYTIDVCGESVSSDDTWVDLGGKNVDAEELDRALGYLPNISEVNLVLCDLSNEEKTGLHSAFPDITFYWTVSFFGKEYRSTDTKIDLNFVNIDNYDDIAALLKCLMNPEYVDLARQGFSSIDMSELSEQFPETKIVWMVPVGSLNVRTDILSFDGTTAYVKLTDQDIENLRYCTWLQAVNLSNSKVTDLTAIARLPNLRVLDISGAKISDLSPVSQMPLLDYLDAHGNSITDISAIGNLTELKDLNLSKNSIDDFSPVLGCGKLSFAVLSQNPAADDVTQVSALIKGMPECMLDFDNDTAASGWKNTERSRAVEQMFSARNNSEPAPDEQ